MSAPTNLIGKLVGNNRIELVSLLGSGSYGAVYRGVLHRSGLRSPKHCAVKVQRNTLEVHQRLCLHRELDLHRRVSDGDGIVTLYETFKEGAYIFIVMKFCPDGDLWTGINKGYFLGNDPLIKDVFTQVLNATEYCHSRSVYHRDIKPENILLCNDGHKALLADFGLATDEQVSSEMRLGSPWYMSPECWGTSPFAWEEQYSTAPNDVWSLGILLINLTCGRHAPWKCANLRDSFFKDFTQQPNLLRLFVPLSPQVHDILARIFTTSSASRISIQDLKIAIKGVTCFTIPSSRRSEYYDYQRAVWKATIGPSPSRPLSIKIIPVFRPSSPTMEDDESTNISEQTTFVPSSRGSPELDINHDTTIVDTLPRTFLAAREDSRDLPALPHSSSSASSVDSDGPTTPDMPATIPDIEVPDIADLSQIEPQGLQHPIFAPKAPPPPKTVEIQLAASRSWRGILDAIRAI